MDEKTMWCDLGKENPNTIGKQTIRVGDIKESEIICPSPSKSSNYNRLINKPSINGVTLEGNKTSEDLGLDVADANYVHEQSEASSEWVIVRNLNKYPAVSIIDSAGDEVIGNIHYDSLNQVTITFIGAFKGKATLN